MHIGKKVKKLRELRNLTQGYVANSLGITQPTYSRYEKGDLIFTQTMIQALSQTLSLSPDTIRNFNENNIIYYIDGFYRCSIIIEELRKENATLRISIQSLHKKIKETAIIP